MNNHLFDSVRVKAELLSSGIRISKNALKQYGPPYINKRRAYGNSDLLSMRHASIPQELYIGGTNIISAVNIREKTDWILDYADSNFYISDGTQNISVTFPYQPPYYNTQETDGFRADRVVTLYGGGALGIFAYGDCSLVSMGKACQYCSIESNRSKSVDFVPVTSTETVYRAVTTALQHDSKNISQVMLNGGNFPDLNKSFSYYLRLAESARRATTDLGFPDFTIHLIAFPPSDLSILNDLKDLNVEVAFNTEVYDSSLFEQYCPGKAVTGGHKLLYEAQDKAVSVLGAGKVFSIFVGGLEPVPSLRQGLEFCAERGVTPVINVFHADPETPLSSYPCPSPQTILEMGYELQKTYIQHDITEPFYSGCGRNSLDTEAHLRLFEGVHDYV